MTEPPVIPLTPEQQQLVEDNLAFAPFMANKLRNQSIMEYEDLIATCMEGLARAAKTFDPDKGVRFTSYASIVIPHWLEHQQRRLRKRYGREFLLEDIMQSENDFHWEEKLSNQEMPLDETILDSIYAEQALKTFIPTLTPKEQTIVNLFTINPHITQIEIGEELGVSQAQISRIILKLRSKFQNQEGGRKCS